MSSWLQSKSRPPPLFPSFSLCQSYLFCWHFLMLYYPTKKKVIPSQIMHISSLHAYLIISFSTRFSLTELPSLISYLRLLIENKEKEREKERDKDSAYFSPPSGQTKILTPPSPPSPNHQYHHHNTNNNGNGTAPASTFQNGRSVSPTSSIDPSKSGMLVIRVVEARGLTLPTGFDSTISQNHPHYGSPTNSSRESLQRKWWLPYAVLEFDKNEVLIDALGGEMSNPVWQYRAHL